MYKALAKILCGVISATCTLSFLTIDEQKPEDEKINLQSPSLVYVSMAGRYANADVIARQEEADRIAEEADTEEEADAARIYNSEFFIPNSAFVRGAGFLNYSSFIFHPRCASRSARDNPNSRRSSSRISFPAGGSARRTRPQRQ